MTLRSGVRIGVDVGRARVGVARSDANGLLAVPVETIARGSGDIEAVIRSATEFEAIEFVVGLPLSLSGAHTASTDDAVAFAQLLGSASGLPVRVIDERLSSVSAQHALHSTGRDSRRSRPVIDQVAATIILQHALDSERSSGNPPGELVILDER